MATRSAQPSILPGAKVMIVGEFPTVDDCIRGACFSGTLRDTLASFLHSAGINLADCSISCVMLEAPLYGKDEYLYSDKGKKKPAVAVYGQLDRLAAEVRLARPNVVIALGNLALWALTRKLGLMKWRGSVLEAQPEFGQCKVIPTIDPRTIMRMWEWNPLLHRDLTRARDESSTSTISRPAWNFTIRPSYEAVHKRLNLLIAHANLGPLKLAVDIETRCGLISCIGLAWSRTDALCIPLMAVGAHGNNYWGETEEEIIAGLLQKLLTHPNVSVIGQNFSYDAQYFALQMGFIPNLRQDTMLMQHVFLPGMKKSLDFLASMYSEYYVYWKDDGKEWDPKIPEEQYWSYNCEDCVRTFEVAEVLEDLLARNNLTEQYAFLLEMWPLVLRTMLRGVRVDKKLREVVAHELMDFIGRVQSEIFNLLGHQINLASPMQLMKLFYNDLALKPIKNRKTGQPTTNDDALQIIKRREPILTGLVDRIAMVRSASVLLSTFALMPLDTDQRMRCYYNLAGTETFRMASGQNAFGSGGNLQNIPAGDEEKAVKKKLELIAQGQTQLLVPNIRRFFVPDPGMTFFDVDLDRADLMVVIWEADDDDFRAAVAAGVDLHKLNASVLFGVPESSVSYSQRQAAKMFAHGTNYGGSARTMAANCGLTVHVSEVAQRRWFAAHPGIKEWHRRTEASLQATRSVSNCFGFRRRYFDRIESILPEALAWVPQSTVAIVINKGWANLSREVPEVQVLLQVHDSLAGQFPTHLARPIMRRMKKCLEIPIPYEKPLTIGVGIATSTRSWGDKEDVDWPEDVLQAPAAGGIIIAS